MLVENASHGYLDSYSSLIFTQQTAGTALQSSSDLYDQAMYRQRKNAAIWRLIGGGLRRPISSSMLERRRAGDGCQAEQGVADHCHYQREGVETVHGCEPCRGST